MYSLAHGDAVRHVAAALLEKVVTEYPECQPAIIEALAQSATSSDRGLAMRMADTALTDSLSARVALVAMDLEFDESLAVRLIREELSD